MTIRIRLTVLYGALFLLAGAVLLGVTYLLVQQTLAERGTPAKFANVAVGVAGGGAGGGSDGGADGGKLIRVGDEVLTPEQFAQQLRDQEAAFEQATLNTLLTRGAIALGVVGLIAVGVGFVMADRTLRPLQRITDTARRVADRSLHERIALAGPPDEIKELADTFDAMLDRLDRSFDGQRRFVANASHELRTPLTINRTLIEVALDRPGTPPETDQLGRTLLAVNARHERLIDGLLMLARSENALTERTPVDLAEVARHVVDGTATDEVTIRCDARPAPTTGDPVLLERLVQNLVENAVRYNVPDGWVTVATGRTPQGQAHLQVVNSGPVVAPYEVERLFEPFRRLAGDRVAAGRGLGLGPGSSAAGRSAGLGSSAAGGSVGLGSSAAGGSVGLGLSIVRSVARAHGGTVTAVPREGGGLVVQLTL